MKQRDIRPYVLAETNWKSVKDTRFEVAVLPWGATEAHNYHLPYSTDNVQAESVAIAAAKKAWLKNAKVIVLPTIPFGVNTGQLDISLCMNMNPSTQYAILKDVVQSLSAHNISKLVILNSHGGNSFKPMIRELSVNFPDVFVSSVNWWQVCDAVKYFNEPGDHAGELETSVMMHLKPGWVLPLDEAGSGDSRKFAIKGLRDGWVSAQRQWTQVSADTGVGNPQKATAEKGKAFFEAVVDEISGFLIELSRADLKDMYE